jgi:hypothetical protein
MLIMLFGRYQGRMTEKMEETEEEEHPPVISVLPILEDDTPPSKPDEYPTQKGPEMNLNKVFHEANM